MSYKSSYPKVLIVGETFRFTGGGGITLINLFKDWQSDKIAVVTEKINESTSETNCRKFYRLGNLEIKFPFPFRFINRIDPSGEVDLTKFPKNPTNNKAKKRKVTSSIKYSLEKAYYRLLVFLGFINSNYKIVVSAQLLNWIREYSPDIIYAQSFRYRDMAFALELKRCLGIPMALHIMDDSVSFANKLNLLHFYWRNKINTTFKQLVESADIHLSISQAMSDEYFKRYNKQFIPFRNPIDINDWTPYLKNDWSIKEKINIIYTGRLAVPNINALYVFCKVVEKLNSDGYLIKLHIYSIDINKKFNSQINGFKSVVIHKSVPFKEIPALISKFDIAFFPIDFTNKGIKYLQYSISTKTSEFMLSGVPILLFASKKVALTSYAETNKCMKIVSENNSILLEKGLKELINSEELRASLALKAREVAKKEADSEIVTSSFRKALSYSKLYTEN